VKRAATLLLLLVAAIYAAARSFEHAHPWLAWVRAFAEAAMVGALADWFAVVALFRHPMGIPIPHTAILRRKQPEIGRTLAGFVVGNFLGRDVVAGRLDRIDLAAAAARWLGANAEGLSDRACALIPWALSAADDEDIARLLHAQVVARLRDFPAAPLLGRLLGIVASGDKFEPVIHELLRIATDATRENREAIAAGIRREIPVPDQVLGIPLLGPVKDHLAGWVARRVVDRAETLLSAAAGDPGHPLRREFRLRLARFVADLADWPEYLARGEELKAELLANEAVAGFARAAWDEIKRGVVADLARPDSGLRRRVASWLGGFAAALERDASVRAKLNAALRGAIPEFIEAHRDEVRKLIEETVRAWDPGEMTAKLEDAVGRDLQFIRINGTLIGGCVGLALHALGILFWPA
jgi:uncharacterized membrane-anchored protein YjiN (DUF445 family)